MARIKEHFGFDCSGDIRDFTIDDRDYLIEIVKRHKVIRWRNQNLTAQEYLNFSEIFGECWANDDPNLLGGNGEERSKVPGYNKITRVSNKNEGVLSDYEVAWHSDVIHKPFFSKGGTNPFRLLYAVTLPSDVPTITKWSDCEYGYDNTPESLKEIAHKLNMFCEAPYKTTWRGNIIPFLSVDATTNRKSFKLERTFFTNFIGMSVEASKELMDQFFQYTIVPENVIEHTWAVGDILLTNNYNTIHQREKFNSTEERTLWRTTFQIEELIPLNIRA